MCFFGSSALIAPLCWATEDAATLGLTVGFRSRLESEEIERAKVVWLSTWAESYSIIGPTSMWWIMMHRVKWLHTQQFNKSEGKKQHSWPPHTAKSWRKWELDIKSNVEPKFSEKRPSSCSNSWGSIFLFKPFHPQKNWKVAVSPVAAGWIPTSRLGGAASNSFWSAVFQGPLRYPLVS